MIKTYLGTKVEWTCKIDLVSLYFDILQIIAGGNIKNEALKLSEECNLMAEQDKKLSKGGV